MPISLAELASDTSTVTFTYRGSGGKLTYRPSLVTQETLDRLDQDDNGTTKFLIEVVSDWDLMIGPKKKVPITEDGINKLPLSLKRAVVQAILGDNGQGEAESSSADG